MCSYLHVRPAPRDSRDKESDHCLRGKHLPRGNLIPVGKDSASPLRLPRCAVANSEGEVSQVCVPWANRLTKGQVLGLQSLAADHGI